MKKQKPIKTWLWPDHAISKTESRQLREEHNATVNVVVELVDRLRSLVKVTIEDYGGPSAEMEMEMDAATAIISRVEEAMKS